MKKFHSGCFYLMAVLVFCLATTGFGQQTGSIKGTVTDETGNALPGVNITVSSPNMQGTRTFVSTTDGDFRFPSLPPGTYTVRVELPSFKTLERPGVRVSLASTTTIIFQMTPSTLNEQVTVTAATPIIDVTSSNISVKVSEEVMTKIPIRRDVLDVYQSAPATVPMTADNDYQKSASVAGGGLEQSRIALDGVDLVDPSRGYVSADISFDAVEEVEMVVGGQKAEAGQASAGFLNVVTKSGGNSFSGTFTMGGNVKAMSQVVVPQEQIDAFGLHSPQLRKYKYDVGASFGGPIIKDRLWFFVAPRHNEFETTTWFIPFTDPEGTFHPGYPWVEKINIGLAKLTAQLSKNIKWFGMFQYNKTLDIPDYWSTTLPYTPLEALTKNDDSAFVVSSVLTFVLNQNTFVEGHLGATIRKLTLPWNGVQESAPGLGYHIDKTLLWEWGGQLEQSKYYNRRDLNFGLVLTKFVDKFLGADHELKVGASYSHSYSDLKQQWTQPYVYYWNNGTPWYDGDVEPYLGQVDIWSGSITDPKASFVNGMWKMDFFLQDSLKIGKRLTVNLGLRYDNSHGFIPARHRDGWNDPYNNGLANVLLPEVFLPAGSSLDTPAVDDLMVYKAFSPRLGLSYDLSESGKTILKASYARYRDALLTTALESLTPLADKSVSFTWYDDNHDGKLSLPPVDRYVTGSYAPYLTDTDLIRKQIPTNLTVPYTDEVTLGLVQQLTEDFSVTLNGIYKDSRKMLGQFNLNIPKDSEWWIPYTVTDPGEDGIFGNGNDQSLTVYMLRRDAPTNLLQKANVPNAYRKYWGVNLLFNKRMSRGWMFTGSVAVGKSWGNFPNGYLTYSGNQIFWDPNRDINRVGRSDYDRALIIKMMSSVDLGAGFSLSGYFRHFTGGHFTRQVTVYFPSSLEGYKARSSRVQVNAESVNSRDLAPETYMDLRLEKEFSLGAFKIDVFADIFNLFGHWYFTYSQNQLVGGNIYSDGTYAAYPGYGVPSAVFGTRELALGTRIRF